MGRLDDKVAIITGGSTGLGPEMARLFVAEGAKVVLGARREDLVERAASDAGPGAIGMRADVTQEEDVANLVGRALEEFDQIDVMVNNAAVPGTDKFIWEQTLDNWNSTLAVDLTGAMLCTREVLNRSMMERRRGSIINLSSAAGYTLPQRKTHYVTAKAALRAFTKAVAKEIGPMGIRCNCIVPGSIDNALLQNYHRRLAGERGISYEDIRAERTSRVPLRRISSTSDVANLALFLASDESNTMTGQSIVVDAGAVLGPD
jgi:NAD(P)-dependent dehydrogenase (short-subunit alcohol dehydrogenase family)